MLTPHIGRVIILRRKVRDQALPRPFVIANGAAAVGEIGMPDQNVALTPEERRLPITVFLGVLVMACQEGLMLVRGGLQPFVLAGKKEVGRPVTADIRGFGTAPLMTV